MRGIVGAELLACQKPFLLFIHQHRSPEV